ncbi:flavin-containing monooxygenase 5-like [Uloborus diversus]|uniref:flavin-containing monooxygenase 5-like n=1 Tax=Uloborus diversus TaxID=327109 RepID=UPI00240921F8|nr:flavin-containing monooxygenase 5-like [Uloborus diversus]
MSQKKKRVAVIGGGYCGIVSIASLKEEGLEPVCFEKSSNFGGTWFYREKSTNGQASIMPTTIINHSKEVAAFSNFPPKKEYNNFMRHSEIYQYIAEYVKHNDVERHIQYNMEVIELRRTEDFVDTGRWIVSAKNIVTEQIHTDVYDAVMVCVGHINRPKMAQFPGQENFKGEIMHTHSLKGVERFKGKRIVIVGIGCSGLDAAVELSSVAKQVYLSSRAGAFIVNRLGPNGLPIDYVLFRRYLTSLLDLLPTNLCSWYIETFYLDRHFDHRLYAIKPKYHLLSKDPIINDHIASKLLSGAVIQKGDIEQFTENGVIFSGENTVTETDVVVMATGYTFEFPFIENGVIIKDDGILNLYKCIFPPQLQNSTLAMIGFILPFGPGWPLAELQTRYAVSVLAGKNKLPKEAEMMEDIKRRHQQNLLRYSPSEKMSIRVDFVQYMDEIAQELGAKPNLWKLMFTDFRLFLRLVFGPCLPYQYRLDGPYKWDGAREALLTSDERLHWPLQQKKIEKKGFFESLIEYVLNLIPKNIFL